MPQNVHLLTLDRIVQNDTTLLLLRLEHALEKDQNNGKNQDVTVDLEASSILFLMSLYHSLDPFIAHIAFSRVFFSKLQNTCSIILVMQTCNLLRHVSFLAISAGQTLYLCTGNLVMKMTSDNIKF